MWQWRLAGHPRGVSHGGCRPPSRFPGTPATRSRQQVMSPTSAAGDCRPSPSAVQRGPGQETRDFPADSIRENRKVEARPDSLREKMRGLACQCMPHLLNPFKPLREPLREELQAPLWKPRLSLESRSDRLAAKPFIQQSSNRPDLQIRARSSAPIRRFPGMFGHNAAWCNWTKVLWKNQTRSEIDVLGEIPLASRSVFVLLARLHAHA